VTARVRLTGESLGWWLGLIYADQPAFWAAECLLNYSFEICSPLYGERRGACASVAYMDL